MMNLIELLKKSIAVLILAFLASAMLSACSSDEEEAPPPAEEETGVGTPEGEDHLCDDLDGEEKEQCLDELENEI
jgi:hypothetical protein